MVDYSKWKDIEVSDDEDDTHPNIDTASLFRWRHQARVERMREQEVEKESFQKEKQEYESQVKVIKEKMKAEGDSLPEIKKALEELEKKGADIRKKQEDLEKKEKLQPWNIDTISKAGFSKTVINVPEQNKNENMTEEEKEKRMREFVKKNEALIKKYGMFRNYDDSRRFLQENSFLACEDTANYLVIWCINLEMEEKTNLMEHVAHQTICMQFILELAKSLDRDPRSCVSAFFHRIQQAEAEYLDAFHAELEAFKQRVVARAKQKIQEAMAEAEEEERKARLGPGGLDPLEVLETLPKELRDCFESQNIDQLKKTIEEMKPEEATYHMKRCVDSGLWVPGAGVGNDGLQDSQEDEDGEGQGKEENPYSVPVSGN